MCPNIDVETGGTLAEWSRIIPFDPADIAPADRAMRLLRDAMTQILAAPDLDAARNAFQSLTDQFPTSSAVSIQSWQNSAGLEGEWIVPRSATPRGVMIYLHGGGFILGSHATVRARASSIAALADCAVVTLHYRRAPENPFPAALEDCLSAYHELVADGWDPQRIIVGGESVGGGLTVSVLQALRDAGEVMPAAGICISPWIDLNCSAESYVSRAKDDPFVTREGLLGGAAAYLGATSPSSAGASPIFSTFERLPPLLIQVGSREVLYDDAENLARTARSAGTVVDFQVWEGMFHEWHMFSSFLPSARHAIDEIARFVDRYLAG